MKLVYNVGINSGKYPTKYKDGNGLWKHRLEYEHWCDLIKRCNSKNYHRRQPTYKDCSVSDNFKHYEYFYEWCQDQIGFGNQGWHLDKDLLMKGNKVYSEDTCLFLPRQLNNLFIKIKSKRGDFPIGVHYYKRTKKFRAQLNVKMGVKKSLGYYNTPEEAFYAYKEAKELFIKEQANKWKDKIDPRAFEALMNYEVDVDD